MLLWLAGCGPHVAGARITLQFQNETKTKCVMVSAKGAGPSVASQPPAINRKAGADTMVIGLSESGDLAGTIDVTVKRFSANDCTAASLFDTSSKPLTLVKEKVSELTFTFTGEGAVDGGTDAGVDGGTDGGADGGCDTSACGQPGPCEQLPVQCGCVFTRAPVGTTCPGGVCSASGSCVADVCSVAPEGTSCDDGLACTTASTCQGGTCVGTVCGNTPPACNRTDPTRCDSVTPTSCALTPAFEGSTCNTTGVCLVGACQPWLNLGSPINLRTAPTDFPYPDGGWALASPDGGVCDTVISTSGTPSVTQGDCGTPALIGGINDAGVAVFEMTSLTVGTNARLHFVGTRPAQLIVLGNATVSGVISVAPLLANQLPAGAHPMGCAAGADGTNKQGGGGGAFGANGGAGGAPSGGTTGGAGGMSTSGVTTPQRGGCPGGQGSMGISGGTGGGALQLLVAGAFTMPGGIVTASGGGGLGGTADNTGGGGGGSGGQLIIEADTINLTGGFVTANGGGGGAGGDNGKTAGAGALGPIASATAAAAATSTGSGGAGGIGGVDASPAGTAGINAAGNAAGGGGGGSVGVIFLRGKTSCTRGGGIISGAQPMSFTCN